MTNWAVGDLAVWDENAKACAGCSANPETEGEWLHGDGPIEVVRVSPPEPGYDVPQIAFAFDPPDEFWCSCAFIRSMPTRRRVRVVS